MASEDSAYWEALTQRAESSRKALVLDLVRHWIETEDIPSGSLALAFAIKHDSEEGVCLLLEWGLDPRGLLHLALSPGMSQLLLGERGAEKGL